MKFPNFNEEKKLWRKGFLRVAGLDEVGRGPLAGPVVAGAVIIDPNFKLKDLKINDSKLLSEKRREELYAILTNHPEIEWGISVVSEKIIDKINILEATKLAMKKALEKVGRPDFLLIDGNFKIDSGAGQKSIVKGDQRVFSIAAASIIAKVYRDRLMEKMHKTYPGYGFNLHKGYGTALHLASLKKIGPCKIHRKTFAPINIFLDLSTEKPLLSES